MGARSHIGSVVVGLGMELGEVGGDHAHLVAHHGHVTIFADQLSQGHRHRLVTPSVPHEGSRYGFKANEAQMGRFLYSAWMPDSMGKRQRRDVKTKKAAAAEQRRLARAQRREDRAAGLIEPGPPLAEPEPDEFPDDEPRHRGEVGNLP
jgi:hypothetical protein